jgi:5-methylcytosine-specific restriction endonuclease McrA
MSKPKPYNGGKWTEARMRSFAMSAIRRARWPQKYQSIAKAYVRDGINPMTGKPCKLHQCPVCKQLFPKGKIVADHIEPVIPTNHTWGEGENWLGYNWNQLLPRLWCEQSGYRAICKECHKKKSNEENQQRKKNK